MNLVNEMDVNEVLNLDSNSVELQEIVDIRESVSRNRMRLEMEYSEELELYNSVISTISKKIMELNGTVTPFKICGMLSQLLYSGNIYCGKKDFVYDDKTNFYNDFAGHYGIDVLNGHACCRHLANFFADVLNELGFKAIVVNNDIIRTGKTPSFMSKIKDSDFEFGEVEKEFDGKVEGNHASILFAYGEHFFMFDPTNQVLLSVSGLEAKAVNGDFTCVLEPTSVMVNCEYSVEEMKELFKELKNHSLLTKRTGKKFAKEIEDAIDYAASLGTSLQDEEMLHTIAKMRGRRMGRIDGSIERNRYLELRALQWML